MRGKVITGRKEHNKHLQFRNVEWKTCPILKSCLDTDHQPSTLQWLKAGFYDGDWGATQVSPWGLNNSFSHLPRDAAALLQKDLLIQAVSFPYRSVQGHRGSGTSPGLRTGLNACDNSRAYSIRWGRCSFMKFTFSSCPILLASLPHRCDGQEDTLINLSHLGLQLSIFLAEKLTKSDFFPRG